MCVYIFFNHPQMQLLPTFNLTKGFYGLKSLVIWNYQIHAYPDGIFEKKKIKKILLKQLEVSLVIKKKSLKCPNCFTNESFVSAQGCRSARNFGF